MASTRAIAATTAALKALLERAAAASTDFVTVDVEPFQGSDLGKALGSESALALSIYLYRMSVSGLRRNLPPTMGADGHRHLPPIPVDLYYLITAWGGKPLKQQELLGWAVRVLDDTPSLPAALLNDGGWRGVFGPNETVELVWQPLTLQEESDLWQVAPTTRQPSASYVARAVEIESPVRVPEPRIAQTRELAFAKAGGT